MTDFIACPVCERGVSVIVRWRGIYLCTPCKNKYEKIELIIKTGQVLDGPKLQAVLKYFGEEELAVIENSEIVSIYGHRKKRKKKV